MNLSGMAERRWIFFPLALAGVAVLVLLAKGRSGPQERDTAPAATPVAVVEAREEPFAPRVTGYGPVRPKREWRALAEVSGRVIYRHPRLEVGRTIAAGEALLRIDPLDYELQLAQAKADLASAQGELVRLEARRSNTILSLEIQQRQVGLARREQKRNQELFDKQALSQSAYDQVRQNLLTHEQALQGLINELSLNAADRGVSEAKVRLAEARVAEAQRLLAKTEVTLPFAARIAAVEVELDQVVSLGATMVRAQDLTVMEVEAQVPLHEMRRLGSSLPEALGIGSRPFEVEEFALPATLRINLLGSRAEWPARVVRIRESVSEAQGTVGVVAEVEQDLDEVVPGRRPPLINGMFAELLIDGLPRPLVKIPEEALHGTTVYLMDEAGRLALRTVTHLFSRDGWSAVEGVTAGERVVVTQLDPAIPGIALRAVAP